MPAAEGKKAGGRLRDWCRQDDFATLDVAVWGFHAKFGGYPCCFHCWSCSARPWQWKQLGRFWQPWKRMKCNWAGLGWSQQLVDTSCLLYHENHCIGLRGNLEQTMVFTYFYMLCLNHIYIYNTDRGSCRFSLTPILDVKMIWPLLTGIQAWDLLLDIAWYDPGSGDSWDSLQMCWKIVPLPAIWVCPKLDIYHIYTPQKMSISYGKSMNICHCIGLRDNLQETMAFTISDGMGCPICWQSEFIYDLDGCHHG